jgi:hypothetical protein
MARTETTSCGNSPRDTVEYLPVRAKCPDNRLRMVNVAHRWRDGVYVLAPDSCGRIPARAPNYQGFRDVAGFYASDRCYPRLEE